MRQFPDTAPSLLSLVVSGLLHVGLVVAWLQHQPSTTGTPAAQEITVDLFSGTAETIAQAPPPAVQPLPEADTAVPKPVPRPVKPTLRVKEIRPATESIAAQEHQPAPLPRQVAAPVASVPAITPARHDADYLHNPHPEYPGISRRMNEQGRVLLHVEVSAEGLPGRVDIKQSSGFLRLDDTARKTVMLWRFVPAQRGDQPVASSVDVPIQFSLQK